MRCWATSGETRGSARWCFTQRTVRPAALPAACRLLPRPAAGLSSMLMPWAGLLSCLSAPPRVLPSPLAGSSAYPVTLFTDAPPALLEQALAAVADLAPPPGASLVASPGASSAAGGSSDAGALLVLQEASVCTPAGGVAVAGLTLALHPGQHLLITGGHAAVGHCVELARLWMAWHASHNPKLPRCPAGPNGCGKSTFVKALCGLTSLAAGSVQLPSSSHDSSPMFVPQRPLAAPGAALWQQLCYPGESSSDGSREGASPHRQEQQQQPARPPDDQLLALLARVGLEYLPERAGGSLDGAADWGGMLSPGELQRLTVARVLYR